MNKSSRPVADSTTEEKIKQAARKVFTQKGFAASRTRDIAEEAGINLALLNYYFRSKEKLFDIVMMENMQQFFPGVIAIMNNESLSLTEKITAIVENYINMLRAQPDLPLFVLSEIRASPDKFAAMVGKKNMLPQSHLYKQIKAVTKDKINPLQFIVNVVSLTVFPFIASPVLQNIADLKQAEFDKLMEERKKLIPAWIDVMLKMK